jgi:spermidine/putrescine transport system substrate-binding protein
MFINFLCRPDIALMNTKYIGYSTPNAEAFKLLPQEMRENPIYWPTDEILERCEVMLDLGAFTIEYDRAWTEILASR